MSDTKKKMNIKVTEELHDGIKRLGVLGEDYGDVVQRLYDAYIKQNGHQTKRQ